jgi:alpha-galactosidase
MLADRELAGERLAGDGYLVFDGGVVGFLSAASTLGTVVVNIDGSLEARWLLDDLALDVGESLTLDSLAVFLDDPGVAYDTYAVASGRVAGARPFQRSARVWCSWYQYFGAITPSIIRANLELAAQHGIEVVQIDDGWQAEIGVWDRPNATWAEPMSALASDIKAKGCVPGIWTAPFLAIDGGSVATEHPEWLVRNERGEPTTALHHGGWGGKIFALDTTNPEVLAHLTATYATLRAQGYDYFKIDFLHAASAVGTRRNGATMSRAKALRAGLAAVRAGIGEDAYLVGCGSPLLSAVGYVDAMRVSEDVAPYFSPRVFFPGFEENTVAARNAIEASVLRAPLHQRWFTVDPDCVLLRPTDTELSRLERTVVKDAALAASGFVALSDDLALYNAETWREAKDLFADAASFEGPRRIVDPFENPVRVVATNRTFAVGWDPPFTEQ